MAASSKYDMSSSSPDGSSYLNGPRGSYASASLEKSGSFREGMESRLTSSLVGMARPGPASSQGDTGSLVQSLLSDLKPMILDQKFPRPGEVKRSIINIVGVTSEDGIHASFSTRALSSSSFKEIRRLRNNISDGSLKARDRAKVFSEATSKIDKYSHNMTRKRSRTDSSSAERPSLLLSGGSTPRPGPPHPNANGIEAVPQKLEERVKSGVPSRRVRTSRVDGRVDARGNIIARPPGPIERDKEASKLVNIGTTLLEEKSRVLPNGFDGWEKSNMKKKRSVIKSDVSANAALARPLESDRESKRGIQQKLINDARPRLSNAHGFRSGPVTAATVITKTDSPCQQNGLGVRPFSRNEQETGSLANDRRDRSAGSEKDGATLKAAYKINDREDNYAASPTTVVQVNASARGPRSNSGSMFKASPNVHRVMGSSDDWEHSSGANKLNASVGPVNRKRSTPASSPSPPVAQSGGLRPQKITRVARRSNLTPTISGHDEISGSDMVDNAVINDGGVFARRLSSNPSQQSKSKGDHVPTPALLENEDSGASDSKSKDKGKKCRDTEERVSKLFRRLRLWY